MKKRDLYAFMRGLKFAKFEHPRCTHAINKNKRLVKEAIADMEEHVDPSDKMKEFTKEREELAKKHCVNDESGKPKLKKVPGNEPGSIQMIYEIPGQDDEKSKYRKDLTKLEKKFKEAVDAHETKVKKYNEEFLDDKSEYEPFMLPLSLLDAHEKCPQHVMDLIFWMVDDTK
jgi:DNA-binding transcriptional regulator GbsR (MarR family)